MKLWLRNLLTRCIAIAPSLVVCSVGGSAGAGRLIIIASVTSKLFNLILVINHVSETMSNKGSMLGRSTDDLVL